MMLCFFNRLTIENNFLIVFYQAWTNFIEKVELIDKFMLHNKRKSMNIEFKRLMFNSFRDGNKEMYLEFIHRLIDETLEYLVIKHRLFFKENDDDDKETIEQLEEQIESIKFVNDILKIVLMFISMSDDDIETYFKNGLLRRLELLFKTEKEELEGQKIRYINYVLRRGIERDDTIKQFLLEKWRYEIVKIYKSNILGVFVETFFRVLDYSEQEELFFTSKENNFVNLKKIKDIFLLYDDAKTFEKFFSGYITYAGAKIIKRNKDPELADKCTIIQDLVGLKNSLDTMIKLSLNELPEITGVIHKAFEEVAICEPNSSKLISEKIVNIFIEEAAENTINLEEKKEFIECVMFILGTTVPEKDEFEIVYRNRLSTELIKRNSKLSDQKKFRETTEIFIDNYLKKDFGVSFLKKIYGMIEDLKMSDEAAQSFNFMQPRGIELDMRVLTKAYWPESAGSSPDAIVVCTSNSILPTEMQNVLKDFCTFFTAREKRNQFMKLDMDCFYATSVVYIEGKFPRAGTKTIITSLPEALVLLCFREDGSSTTLANIVKSTGIRESDVKKIIRVFSSKNVGILKVNTESSKQTIEVNDKFDSKKSVVRIRKKTPKETVPTSHVGLQVDSAEKRELIFKREEHVDCLLIRALKGAQPKTIDEIMEFVAQWASSQKFFVGFKPDQKYVNERLESLIKMSYVAKNEDTYEYVP